MEKRRLSTVFTLLYLFIILFVLPVAAFAEAVGTFSRVEGRVDMLREGKGSAVIVKVGDSVLMGDIIRTKSDGKAEILFRDKTTVSLAPKTRIKIDEYIFNPDNSRKQGFIGLFRGKIRAVVSKAKVASAIPVATGASTFNIQTPTATAGVRGTDLFVFYNRGVTGVLFKEGLGFVYNNNMPGRIVNVSAGQITYILRPDTPPLPPRQATDAELSQHVKDATVEEKPEEEEAKTNEDTEAPEDAAAEEKPAEETGKNGDTGVSEVKAEEPAIEDIVSSVTAAEPFAGPEAASGAEISAEGIIGAMGTATIGKGGDATELTALLPVTETVPEALADTTSPQIAFKTTPPLVASTSSAGFSITSDEPATFTYSLDGGTPLATSGTLNLTGLAEGTHVIQVTATDSAGNTSTISHTWFYGQEEYALGGSVSDGSGFAGSATGSIATVSDQNWGGWSLSMGGNAGSAPSSSWTLLAGGKGYDGGGSFNGYWLGKIDGTASANILSGTSYLQYLSYYALGTGIGILNGAYDELENWEATDVSLDMYAEAPLAFVSEINEEASRPDGGGSYFYSLLGGTESIWSSSQASPADITWMGEYGLASSGPFRIHPYSYNYSNNTYTTYDGGAYYGFMGGTDFDNILDSAFYALYTDPNGNAGILMGALTGATYPDLGMFEAEGGIYPIQITSNAGITAESLYDSIVDKIFFSAGDTDFKFNGLQMVGFGRRYKYSGEFLSIGSSEWGIWNTRTAGYYSGITVSDSWSWSQVYNDGSMIFGTETNGSQWSGGKLTGSTVGYGADLSSASTWISVGEAIGTFDAAAQAFDVLTMGTFLSTDQFLQMTATAEGQAALQQLNIPFAEVGRATLTGTDGNLSVDMNDVIFFAYSNGTAPSIWAIATNGINGTYAADPAANAVVNLSGSGLSANLTVQQWTGGNWMSTVSGSGTYSGTGTLNGSSVQLSGAAAGTYGSGAFSGTGAGVAK